MAKLGHKKEGAKKEITSEDSAFLKGFESCLEYFKSTINYPMTSNQERLKDLERLYNSYKETFKKYAK